MTYSTAKAVCNVCGRTTTAIGRLFHQDSCRERATARIYKRRHWSILLLFESKGKLPTTITLEKLKRLVAKSSSKKLRMMKPFGCPTSAVYRPN